MNLKDFQSWALSQGSVANPAPNYKYKGECVSLIQQLLYQVLGIPFKARGNAKDWATNSDVLAHFNKLSVGTSLKAGDILVYGSNYTTRASAEFSINSRPRQLFLNKFII